jgi:hypothetical protein
MNFRLSAIILIALLITACKKDNSNNNKPTQVEVTVQSADHTALSNASIHLLSDQHVLVTSAISGSDGKIDFNVDAGKTYYLFHVAGDTKVISDTDASYIITGTFTSQQQINDSPFQSAATKVGDSIYLDINGDGTINEQDRVKKIVAPTTGTTSNVSLVLGAQ